MITVLFLNLFVLITLPKLCLADAVLTSADDAVHFTGVIF